jgi:hypothetical protein
MVQQQPGSQPFPAQDLFQYLIRNFLHLKRLRPRVDFQNPIKKSFHWFDAPFGIHRKYIVIPEGLYRGSNVPKKNPEFRLKSAAEMTLLEF